MDAVFDKLSKINVNDYTERKNGLTYLTWSKAWEQVKKLYPEASYTICKQADGIPYVYDEATGYMVYTTVTIEGVTHEMWLPVMDGANKAMKAKPYSYKVAEWKGGRKTGNYVDKWVDAATMFDINKTIMRCLVKNLAMFGLGLYIYSGEDLPEEKSTAPEPISKIDAKAKVLAYIRRHNISKDNVEKICRVYHVKKLTELTGDNCVDYIEKLEKNGGNIDE